MKVLIMKASDPDYEEVLEKGNWNELMTELFKRYEAWVIEPLWEFLKRRYPSVDYQCIMYDGYLEIIDPHIFG